MHTPVLLKEVLQQLSPKDGGLYLDATFGAGGYSKAILDSCDCKLIAIDRDQYVQKFANELLKTYQNRFKFIVGGFKDLKAIIGENISFDAIVFDLGVSSMQLEDGSRGFSFLHAGPLDMRMDQTATLTAAAVVNNYKEQELANIIFKYGDEKKSRRIAKAIVDFRSVKKFETTQELAAVIRRVVGKYNDNIDPATRTFQAIRIEVNDEFGQIEKGLHHSKSLLKAGGRLLVVSFHSGEDTIVKKLFNKWCGHMPHQNRHMPAIDDIKDIEFAFLFKGVIEPKTEEIALNSRARSAKLRGIVKI